MKQLALILLTLCCSVNAAVYKWVDKDGKVHYSQMAPLDANTGVETFNDPSKEGGTDTVVTRLPPGGSKFSPTNEELLATIADMNINLAYDNQPLNCGKAVSNVTSGLSKVNEAAQKSFKDGNITDIELEKVQKMVRTMRRNVSVKDCQNSVIKHRAFYTCMSSSYSHVLACLNKHRPS